MINAKLNNNCCMVILKKTIQSSGYDTELYLMLKI